MSWMNNGLKTIVGGFMSLAVCDCEFTFFKASQPKMVWIHKHKSQWFLTEPLYIHAGLMWISGGAFGRRFCVGNRRPALLIPWASSKSLRGLEQSRVCAVLPIHTHTPCWFRESRGVKPHVREAWRWTLFCHTNMSCSKWTRAQQIISHRYVFIQTWEH